MSARLAVLSNTKVSSRRAPTASAAQGAAFGHEYDIRAMMLEQSPVSTAKLVATAFMLLAWPGLLLSLAATRDGSKGGSSRHGSSRYSPRSSAGCTATTPRCSRSVTGSRVAASNMFVGVPLLLGSASGTAIGGALSLLLAARIVGEEKMLATELEGYEAYRARVRYRLLPGIW
jgi:hypothetical protein